MKTGSTLKLAPMWLGLAFLLVLGRAVVAEEPAGDPQAIFDKLSEEYNAARMNAMTKLRAAQTPEEQEKLAAELFPKPADYSPRFLEIAAKHPGTDAARESLSWILTSQFGGEAVNQAVDRLLAEFVDSEALAELADTIGRSPGVPQARLLRGIMKQSPHEKVRAHACLALAQSLVATADTSQLMQGELEPEIRLQVNAVLGGPAGLAELRAFDGNAARREAGELFDTVKAKYADREHPRGKFGEIADRMLFELRTLGIGQPAPEIEGEDIDGVAFKLSDYRGKVVMLDFWGDW